MGLELAFPFFFLKLLKSWRKLYSVATLKNPLSGNCGDLGTGDWKITGLSPNQQRSIENISSKHNRPLYTRIVQALNFIMPRAFRRLKTSP